MRRPIFWMALAALSVAATLVGIRYFPQAFSIVALDITMDRGHALQAARDIAAREGLGPAGFRQAASFGGDDEAQTFVELEGGGKDAFTQMLRDQRYAAYTWRVRHFKDGDPNETTIRFTPDGQPYGFTEKIKEDAPGAALDGNAARTRAEREAQARWHVDLSHYTMVEQGQERRPSGRIDHTITYERRDITLGEGRYRLTLSVAGDRLSGVTHFIKIPEAFTRRYASMRSNNELIGIGSAVGLALLYVIGGIGVGLFFMMRQRWILWRTAAIWGVIVGGLQTLAAINEFPLLWMSYDTAVPRTTFIAQQAAFLAAGFIGFSVFFALSFMAAETLSRRAFPRHPQLWRAWSPEAGASIQILGRTVGGYLLVALFFAYDVLLYIVMTNVFGWWSPAEALVHPDVLATYAPWLSAIANSFQAGFWEESLFRAVPIAGAALIGDRFKQRPLFIAIAFVVQALIFGAGHAPYPNQPAYARPVELIIPSIGFGLLYLCFGLLPGIVLHFTFDVVWFALPVFLAKAPGIWFQQLMIVVLTFVPLFVVFWRRGQVGHWTEMPDALRNGAWTPGAPPPPQLERATPARDALSPRMRTIWLALGAISLAGIVAGLVLRSSSDPFGRLNASRAAAERAARDALEKRGVTLGPKWRVMAIPDNGSGAPHQFVYENAGDARWRGLLGRYLPVPRWRVRVATFEGDVVDRAEEWHVFVDRDGVVANVQHVVPQGRAGASLDETAARALALNAVKERYGLDRAQLRETSARPSQEKARKDWTLTFADTTIAPVGQGEARIDVNVAGDEVASTSKYVYVPEEWERAQRAAMTRNLVIQIATSVTFGGLLIAAAIGGMMAWSRGRYAPRLFLLAAVLALGLAVAGLANSWPALIANLPTVAPLQLQLLGVLAIAAVGLTLLAAMVGLAIGALPHHLAGLGRMADKDAALLGIAAGLFGAAAGGAASAIRTPIWARPPSIDSAVAVVPILDVALDPLAGFLTAMAVLLTAVIAMDRVTAGWTERRAPAIVLLALVGFLSGGVPAGSHAGGWAIAGLLMAGALVIVYVTLLRFDPTLVPLALGTMAAIRSLGLVVHGAFPGAAAGGILAAVLVASFSWWWFRLLRRVV
jgi:hypothetical protein